MGKMIMREIKNRYFKGERILYGLNDANLDGITFGEGESPLKEAQNTTFETMSRSGIWYTKNISIKNSALQAPKLFRRASHIILDNVHFADAEETMWTCDDIKITNSQINGDYFGKDSKNIYLDNVSVVGNYVFDGAENIEVHNSTFVSKDAFWNCKNVTIYNSIIDGEYLAWNTNNIKFINCKIKSDQGLNYIDQLEMKNSSLIHTDLV